MRGWVGRIRCGHSLALCLEGSGARAGRPGHAVRSLQPPTDCGDTAGTLRVHALRCGRRADEYEKQSARPHHDGARADHEARVDLPAQRAQSRSAGSPRTRLAPPLDPLYALPAARALPGSMCQGRGRGAAAPARLARGGAHHLVGRDSSLGSHTTGVLSSSGASSARRRSRPATCRTCLSMRGSARTRRAARPPPPPFGAVGRGRFAVDVRRRAVKVGVREARRAGRAQGSRGRWAGAGGRAGDPGAAGRGLGAGTSCSPLRFTGQSLPPKAVSCNKRCRELVQNAPCW